MFGALRQRLEDIIQSRSKLASKVAAIKGGPSHTAHQKQLLINREVDGLVVQLRGAIQVGLWCLVVGSERERKSVYVCVSVSQLMSRLSAGFLLLVTFACSKAAHGQSSQ